MTLKHIQQVSTSGSSRRGGEPSWLALRSALSLISVKRFPEIKNIPEISGLNMDGMPKGNTISDTVYSTYIKKEKLIEKLHKKTEKYMKI